MNWLVSTFDEDKRDTLECPYPICQTVYPKKLLKAGRMIGSAVLDGHAECAINMTKRLELDTVAATE